MNHNKPIFAANWKMNHGPSDARAFMNRFLQITPRTSDRTLLFFPSALAFGAVAESARERPDIQLGVQNVHTQPSGAFTGENSALMARDAGARFVLVGHSERRHVFGETDEETGLKCALVTEAHLVPVLCVGETLAQREAGTTQEVVERQLAAGLANLDDTRVATMMIAYEPVWAIGTGRTATPEDASQIHTVLRAALAGRLGDKGAAAVPLLYGGSVNRGNSQTLLAAPNVDGVLVGGASLDADVWSSIVKG